MIAFVLHYLNPLISQQINLTTSEITYALIGDSFDELFELLKENGYEPSLVFAPAERLKIYLENNDVDGHMAAIYNYDNDVPGMIRIDPPYIIVNIFAIVSVKSGINSIDELMTLSMASPRGFMLSKVIAARYAVDDVHELDSLEAMLGFIALDRAGFTIFTRAEASQFIGELKLEDELKILPTPVAQFQLYLWLNSRNEEFAEDISAILNDAIQSGEFIVHEY